MAYRGNEPNNGCKLYIGNLPSDATEKELEKAFNSYGIVRDAWLPRSSSGYGFVEFDDPHDAEDACKGMDGRTVCGERVRVEMARGPRPRGGGGGGGRGYGGRGGFGGRRPFSPEDRCYSCGEKGHYAIDCRNRGGRGSGGYGSSRSRSGYGRRSRSYSPRKRSYSRSFSRSRSRSR